MCTAFVAIRINVGVSQSNFSHAQKRQKFLLWIKGSFESFGSFLYFESFTVFFVKALNVIYRNFCQFCKKMLALFWILFESFQRFYFFESFQCFYFLMLFESFFISFWKLSILLLLLESFRCLYCFKKLSRSLLLIFVTFVCCLLFIELSTILGFFKASWTLFQCFVRNFLETPNQRNLTE